MPNTLKGADYLYNNPQARADDLHQAFADNEIKAVISCIGGDDSVRLIDKIDVKILRANPKIFMGYSDTTVSHFVCLKAGLRSYYGPVIMTGFAENTGMHDYLIQSVRRSVFSSKVIGTIENSKEGWTSEHLAWDVPENQSIKRKMHPPMEWQFLQGKASVTGRLLGGCTDVLPMIIGTSVWPDADTWKDAILFLENSEEAMPPGAFLCMLRNLGAQGIIDRISGILFARPCNVVAEKFAEYEGMLLKACAEYGRQDLPIITRMDFGHTDPMFVIPIGAKATIDPAGRRFSIDEPGCR
ncbi:Muramoyltetrapeptide carboxypeptidase LdcA (peptidoglycan recycling) [Stigmatella aurantiaca]|uniref:Muramoyltetrapeptide carboxypeptidase LdcA (Peptidoglycan recycling) n=1 Tax=Stigmatella aurantiaca TaxID=41 RepID=A0A1H7VL86_STIAU|nr:S66 peptidase family protein [Stigmatella aurantiaca]SEM10042.1 Muramoyltetrapeptide carboxypeptidase LdcA (peptidoglycan recycling) [Stigmatella aurantiaca]